MVRDNWILVSLVAIGGIAAFLVNLLWLEMVDLLNASLPDDNEFSYYSSTPWGIAKRYAVVNPRSMRPNLVRIFMAASALCFVGIIMLQRRHR
jgi:hypothetical protein